MWTRDDYMGNRCSHQEYYGEIAEELGISFRDDKRMMDWFVRCLKNGNPYLNECEDEPGPPLWWWDKHGAWMFGSDKVLATLMQRGEERSRAVVVCILKAAAFRDAMDKIAEGEDQ